MAKQEQQQRSPYDERQDRIRQKVEEMEKEQKKLEQRSRMEQSRQNFSERKNQLAERAADLIMQHGKDHYLSQIMLTFLDVAMQMEDAINTLNDVNVAMECITDAVGCMDNILDFNNMSLDAMNQKKYGFWQRHKTKKKIKRTIANNVGRMQNICNVLVGNQMIALSIMNALKDSSQKMQGMMQKNNAKQKKRELKSTPSGAPAQPSGAENLVNGIIAARGGETSPSASGAPSSASATAPSPSSTNTGDISDIL